MRQYIRNEGKEKQIREDILLINNIIEDMQSHYSSPLGKISDD
jgi:hypothetical protein